jgi:hypothetical protein
MRQAGGEGIDRLRARPFERVYFRGSHRHSVQASIVLPGAYVQGLRALHTAVDGGAQCGAEACFMHARLLWKCHAKAASQSLNANSNTAAEMIALFMSRSSAADR